MNLREQLERASGVGEAQGRRIVTVGLTYALVLLALALIATYGLGAAGVAHGPAMLTGAIALNLLLVAGAAGALAVVAPALVATLRSAMLFAALFVIVTLAAAIAARVQPGSPELVPIALLALVLSALYDRRAGLLASVLTAVIVGAQDSLCHALHPRARQRDADLLRCHLHDPRHSVSLRPPRTP